MKKNILIVGLLVFLVLAIDQIIKIWVKTTFNVADDPKNLLGDWLRIGYIENQGMAFGTTFGASMWAKLALSVFRIGAIIGIGIYWFRQAKTGIRLEFLIAVGFIFAGATGNLLDSMFYDFIFKFEPCMSFNLLEGSGIKADCGFFGQQEVRHTGFLFGNVVDMFQFNFYWPKWVPYFSGGQVFPAIWNVADFSISCGVGMVLLRQKKYFPKKSKTIEEEVSEVE